MTIPTLPPQGSTAWYAHYAALDAALREALAALAAEAGPVTSVAGRAGDVLLSAGDITGLGTAAQHAATDFDTAGAAATEQTRALAAEAALAPHPSGSPTLGQAVVVTQVSPLTLGYASAAGVNTLANQAPGSTFDVVYDGTNWKYAGNTVTNRPTARTDLRMIAINSHDGTVPSWAISGTDTLLRI